MYCEVYNLKEPSARFKVSVCYVGIILDSINRLCGLPSSRRHACSGVTHRRLCVATITANCHGNEVTLTAPD